MMSFEDLKQATVERTLENMGDMRDLAVDDIKSSTSSEELKEKIQSASNFDLLQLKKGLKEETSLNRWFSNLSALNSAIIGLGVSVATVAIAYPLAKRQKWTDLNFKSFMKHPASIGLAGLGGAIGVYDKYDTRNTLNASEGYGLVVGELHARGLTDEVISDRLGKVQEALKSSRDKYAPEQDAPSNVVKDVEAMSTIVENDGISKS